VAKRSRPLEPARLPASEFVGWHYTESGSASYNMFPKSSRGDLSDILCKLANDPYTLPGIREITGDLRLYQHAIPPIEVLFHVDLGRSNLGIVHVAETRSQPLNVVFISYAHEDSQWLDEIRRRIKPLQDRGALFAWCDLDIAVGDRWADVIDSSLDAASVALLLVTQSFLDSTFVKRTELPAILRAVRRGRCRLVWLAVSASRYDKTELRQLQAVNDPKRPLDKLLAKDQERVLDDVLAALAPATSHGVGSPRPSTRAARASVSARQPRRVSAGAGRGRPVRRRDRG